MSGTILQAEIDSNHQFVRKKGCLTDKWLKINNLSVKRWVFTDKLLGANQLRESVFSRHSALAMSLLIRRQAGERTLTWSKPSSSKSDAS